MTISCKVLRSYTTPNVAKTAKLTQPSGIDGFIHVAAPISESSDIKVAIPIAVKGALNALKASTKTPSVKRFVFTSSSIAATFPQPDVEFSIDEGTFNEEALRRVKETGNGSGLLGYAAMKTETEMAIVKWMEENKPSFILNSIASLDPINLFIYNTDCNSYQM